MIAKKTGNKLKLSQKKCSFLCDVTMKSVDGKEFPCHKCVLCARLEYFHSMLSSSWIEVRFFFVKGKVFIGENPAGRREGARKEKEAEGERKRETERDRPRDLGDGGREK